MKVTIVQGAFLPVPPVAGGAVEKLWSDLAGEFARRGLSVTHISRRWPGLAREAASLGVVHRRIPGYDYPRSGVLAKLMDLLYSLRCVFTVERSDIIVTNTFFLPILLSLLPWRGAVYVSVHRYPQGQMPLYRGADRLQCVSTAVADAVRSQAPSVGHLVRVVPNYVNGVLTEQELDTRWDARERRVLFVGRVHPEKGLDLLITGFAAVPLPVRAGWRLSVVGPHAVQKGGGGDDYLSALKSLGQKLDVDIDWIGPVYDREELARHYLRASLFVYPTTAAKGEAFPLAPLEAMAQGCPVVTSDLRCFDDYIRPGINAGVFALGERAADRLGMTLHALIADPDVRRDHARQGLATARQFTLGRIADSFVEDFESLRAS